MSAPAYSAYLQETCKRLRKLKRGTALLIDLTKTTLTEGKKASSFVKYLRGTFNSALFWERSGGGRLSCYW